MSYEKHKAGLAVDCIKLEQTPIEKAIWSVLDEYCDAENHPLKEYDLVCDVLQKVEEAVSKCTFEQLADFLIAHGVTVQEHGYWETVVEVKDNTVCGNGVKIEYKRCSCCKNPSKFFEDDFCGNCGAKLDLPQPPKGE